MARRVHYAAQPWTSPVRRKTRSRGVARPQSAFARYAIAVPAASGFRDDRIAGALLRPLGHYTSDSTTYNREEGAKADRMRAYHRWKQTSLLATGAAIIALALPSLASAYRGRRVYVPNNLCVLTVLFKPRAFTPSGDGATAFRALRWHRYGGSTARATGTEVHSVFRPSGGFSHKSAPAEVWLSQPELFAGRYVYTRLRVKLLRPLPGAFSTASWTIGGGDLMGFCGSLLS